MRPQLRLFARLSVASFRRQRLRWMLTTFGIAVGVTSFTGVVAMTSSIVSSFERSITQTAGAAQLQVNNGTVGVDAALVGVIAKLPGVREAAGNVEYNVSVPRLDRPLKIFGFQMGGADSYRKAQFGPDALKIPDELAFVSQIDSVALTADFLRRDGLALGSSFPVEGPKGVQRLVVRGILHPNGALRIFGDNVAVMDSDAAQNAFGQLDKFHWIDVVVEEKADVGAVRSTIASAVTGRGVVDTPFGRGRRMEAMLGTLRLMLVLSGVVAMLVGGFLIYHTVATAVSQRHHDLQTLWALGAPRSHLRIYLIAEVLLVGVVGSLIGIALGTGFAVLATQSFSQVISAMYAPLPEPAVGLTAVEFTLALSLGAFTVLLGGIIPSAEVLRLHRSAERRDPTERRSSPAALAAAGLAAIGVGLLLAQAVRFPSLSVRVAAVAGFAGLVFIGVTLFVPIVIGLVTPLSDALLHKASGVLGSWTWKQVRKHRTHTATTIGSLAAGVAFALGVTILLESYRREFVGWIDQTFAGDVFVNAGSAVSLLGGSTLDIAFQDELRSMEGVRQVMPWRLIEVEFRGRPIIIQGMAESLIDRAYPGLRLDHAAGEVVVSDTLAERYDLAVGDTLTLPAPFSPVVVKIRAVAPDYVIDLGNVKLGWDLFSSRFGERSANIFLVDADGKTSASDLKRRIEERMSGRYDVSVLTQDELRGLVSKLIARSFALTHSLEVLTVLVTICAMVNATSAAIIDRTDDLLTLRALGMPRRQLVTLLTLEGGLVGTFGSLLGLAGGCLLGATFVRTVAPAVAGFRMTVHWPVAAMVALIVLSVAAAAASARLVARRWAGGDAVLDPDSGFR